MRINITTTVSVQQAEIRKELDLKWSEIISKGFRLIEMEKNWGCSIEQKFLNVGEALQTTYQRIAQLEKANGTQKSIINNMRAGQ